MKFTKIDSGIYGNEAYTIVKRSYTGQTSEVFWSVYEMPASEMKFSYMSIGKYESVAYFDTLKEAKAWCNK